MNTRTYQPHQHDHDACEHARVLVRAGKLTVSAAEHYALDDVIAAYRVGGEVTQASICHAHDVIARMRLAQAAAFSPPIMRNGPGWDV